MNGSLTLGYSGKDRDNINRGFVRRNNDLFSLKVIKYHTRQGENGENVTIEELHVAKLRWNSCTVSALAVISYHTCTAMPSYGCVGMIMSMYQSFCVILYQISPVKWVSAYTETSSLPIKHRAPFIAAGQCGHIHFMYLWLLCGRSVRQCTQS